MISAAFGAAPVQADASTFSARMASLFSNLDLLARQSATLAGTLNGLAGGASDLAQAAQLARRQAETATDALVALGGPAPYDPTRTYGAPETALGSDGRVYRCLWLEVRGDDPVISTSGSWAALSPDQDLAVAILCGGLAVPGWDLTSAAAPAGELAPLVAERGSERYRARLAWVGTSGGLDRSLLITLEYSPNAGGTWAPVGPWHTATAAHAGGIMIGWAWNALPPLFAAGVWDDALQWDDATAWPAD